MKVNINNKEKISFKPFTIEIEVEDEMDLKILLALTNVSNTDIVRQSSGNILSCEELRGKDPYSSGLWSILDELWSKHLLKW